MKSDHNQREFTRVPFHITVELTHNQAPPLTCQVRDISLNGLYLVCEHPLPVGSECRVALLLGRAEEPIQITASGTVTRVDDSGMGVEITEIIGLESFEHLRNLVLYNASQPEQVEEEFHTHIGLKRRT
jgi:hypothetical protein